MSHSVDAQSLTLHCSPTGVILRPSPRWAQELGPPIDALHRSSLFELVHPDDAPALRQAMALLHPGRPSSVQVVWRNGDRLRLRLQLQAEGIAVTAEPMDTPAHQTKARQARQHLYTTLVDNALDIIYVKDLDGVYTFINETGAASFDRSPNQVVGKTDKDLFGPEVGREIREIDEGVIKTGQTHTSESDRIVNGKRRCFHTFKSVYIDHNNEVAGVVGNSRDITDLVKSKEATADAQRQLIESGRLASIGQVAAGVAHEINNPLTWVLSHLDALESRLGDLEQAGLLPLEVNALSARARSARQGAERIARVVRDLEVFLPSDTADLMSVPVGPTLEKALQLATPQLRHRARISQGPMSSLPVRANPGRLSRAFFNILQHLGARFPVGAAWQHQLHVEAHELIDELLIELVSTGHSPSEEELRRTFEPYVNPSAVAEGKGMGLWVTKGLITAMGGRISVEAAQPGERIRVWLPLATDLHLDAPPLAPAGRLPRVMVIDDEPELREMIELGLADHVRNLVTLGSGREALAWLEGDADFDLILTDLMMPDIAGMDLFGAVTARWPSLSGRMVVMTGGAFSPEAQRFLAQVRPATLMKPFTLSELRAVLTRAAGYGQGTTVL